MKKIILMTILLFILVPSVFADTYLARILTPEEAGVSVVTPEELEESIVEVVVEDPYEGMNIIEIAVANKTNVILTIVGIVVVYLVITAVVLKLTKKRWK